MALFEFELKPLHLIEPWGEPDNPCLHWFGLTDGHYYLNAKGHELYRYSEDILRHWEGKNTNSANLPYPDYQIVRFYEDLLDILPDVYQPIPDYIFDRIGTISSFELFFSRLNSFYENEENETLLEKFLPIRSFLQSRQLASLHLEEGPNIWFFRNNDVIYLRWLNGEKLIEGIPVWNDIKGEAAFSYLDFVKEVSSFHKTLISQMELRVMEVLSGKLCSKVHIDLKALKNEHEDRTQSLERALRQKSKFQEWETLEMLLKDFDQSLT
jgi:hypothetical protein